MTPAELVITEFKGVRPLARKLGIHPSTVCRWQAPKAEGGSAGFVPQKYFARLMALAQQDGKEISLNDLVFGRVA